MQKKDFKNLYVAYLCNLKKEGYMINVYNLNRTVVYKKEDGSYFDILTEQTYNVLIIDEQGKINTKEEGIYLTLLTPYEEYLKNKEKSKVMRIKK